MAGAQTKIRPDIYDEEQINQCHPTLTHKIQYQQQKHRV